MILHQIKQNFRFTSQNNYIYIFVHFTMQVGISCVMIWLVGITNWDVVVI